MLKDVANIVRGLSADAVERANSGHPGLPLGCAEIGAVLFGEYLNYFPEEPDWINRDRLILSAGHGSMLLYSFLHLTGYDVSLNDLKEFRQVDSKTPGHPEYGDTPGVEATTGPLGQGFSNAVGMALSEKILAEKFNRDSLNIIDHYTYTILGDGCMMEGVTSEAASLAGHLGLEKLIAIYDDNKISIGGGTEIAFTESVADRFKAYNWQVIEDIDGHDVGQIRRAIKEGKANQEQPTLIVARTHIGYGAPTKQDTADVHGAPLGKEDLIGMKKFLGLPVEEEFYISPEVTDYFEELKLTKKMKYEEWKELYNTWSLKYPSLKNELNQFLSGNTPEEALELLENYPLDSNGKVATRKSSGEVLNRLSEVMPNLIGGSADLSPSTKTYLNNYGEIQKQQFNGRNIRFGVREHAMAGVANGISLYGGLRPFVSTFLVFSDYMRPSIRMAAIMKQPVIFIFTHDSIYVGEDGPTHEPVEHLESLRLIPNLKVLRPGDTEEVVKTWIEALENQEGPTALILSRQGVPLIEDKKDIDKFTKGGYVVAEDLEEKVTLMATGSEVSLAMEVRRALKEKGISSRLVSVPDRKTFEEQPEKYREEVLGDPSRLRVLIEAGVKSGWYRFLGEKDLMITMETYGASGPGSEVGKKFGFEAEVIMKSILEKLGGIKNGI
ncbi:transketolase [Isachenkonia alkalipeptolytica]|uniref:Transketolase n=1 Tax=Isachenkonia alkalipeptolytica TaxID=2565777 RepID=A0AA43XKH6_9CLOT|nr:transketolase [Isachenkonia alkalipeptolytica]NBG88503.1 transketolase [Isachenkonia alkalipeptolytica]